jgi:hypothetical protein
MIGRFFAALAAAVEGFVYGNTSNPKDLSCLGSCVHWFLTRSFADRGLNALLKSVAYNASTVCIVVIVVYIVFCVIYAPMYMFSLVITPWGSFGLVLLGIALLLRWFSRSMTFAGRCCTTFVMLFVKFCYHPGSNMSLQKEYSADYIKRQAQQIEQMALFVSQYTATLLLMINNKLPSHGKTVI